MASTPATAWMEGPGGGDGVLGGSGVGFGYPVAVVPVAPLELQSDEGSLGVGVVLLVCGWRSDLIVDVPEAIVA